MNSNCVDDDSHEEDVLWIYIYIYTVYKFDIKMIRTDTPSSVQKSSESGCFSP